MNNKVLSNTFSANNIILSLFFISIPFTQVFIINIGFPLKIAEICVILISLFFILNPHLKIFKLDSKIITSISIFIFLVFISTIINIFWTYDYNTNRYLPRISNNVDSILKFFHLVLAFLSFVITYNAMINYKTKKYFQNIFLLGAILSAIISWYLFIFSYLELPYLQFPGMDENPHYLGINGHLAIRCGTFKEGNYSSLFFLTSGIIAFFFKKYKISIFLFLTILTSLSTTGIICCFVFLFLRLVVFNFNYKSLVYLLIMFSLFILALQNKIFYDLIVSKLEGDSDKIEAHLQYSKVDRINTSKIAFEIAKDNPIWGIGLANYGYHYSHYNKKKYLEYDIKPICNNVFLEVACESGFLAVISFISFLYFLYKKGYSDTSNTLKSGLITITIYLIAFPTYTIIFLWIFFGIISSEEKQNSVPTIET